MEQTLSAVKVTQCEHLLQRRGVLGALCSPIACDFFLNAALGLGATRHGPAVPTDIAAGEVSRKGMSCERTFRNMKERTQLEDMVSDA